MQISKRNRNSPKHAFVLFLKLMLQQNTMSEDEHSDSEFYYPDELESHEENGEATALSGYEQLYENSREEIESFVKEQTSENTTGKTFSDMKTFQRYLSSVNKGNVEVLDLPAGDLDHLLAKFFKSVRRINADDYEPGTLSGLQRSIQRFLSDGISPFNIFVDKEFEMTRKVKF